MGGIYFADILDVLRAAGCKVAENSITNGWQRRARSSGGFSSNPLGVQWHHTASSTSPENDLSWQINGCPDAPVGNMLLDRTGTFWPTAAGAANTAGKGGPLAMSRGTIPVDSANTRTWAIEAANGGTGEPWPVAQIDAYFMGSNALNARFGNRPTDVFNHQTWAPTRKIDPARNNVVQGPWRPASSTSSGTWLQSDVTAECQRRAGSGPTPPPEEDDLTPEQAQQLATIAAQVESMSATIWQASVPDANDGSQSSTWAQLVNAKGEAWNARGDIKELRGTVSTLVWQHPVPDGTTGEDSSTWAQLVNAKGEAAAARAEVAALRQALVDAGVIPP